VVTVPENSGDDVPIGTLKAILRSAGFGGQKMNVKCPVIFERAESNWAAYVPDLPGCMSTGKTLEETKTDIREASPRTPSNLAGILRSDPSALQLSRRSGSDYRSTSKLTPAT
jgi:hypothetical protein